MVGNLPSDLLYGGKKLSSMYVRFFIWKNKRYQYLA